MLHSCTVVACGPVQPCNHVLFCVAALPCQMLHKTEIKGTECIAYLHLLLLQGRNAPAVTQSCHARASSMPGWQGAGACNAQHKQQIRCNNNTSNSISNATGLCCVNLACPHGNICSANAGTCLWCTMPCTPIWSCMHWNCMHYTQFGRTHRIYKQCM